MSTNNDPARPEIDDPPPLADAGGGTKLADISEREQPRAVHDRWLIDRLMPETEINLLAGPAGVGKTTLALQIGTDIQDGVSVWGHRTFQTGMVIVSLDRSENAHKRMIDGMQIPTDRFAFYGLRNTDCSIEILMRACARQFPQHKLLFIDGFATLCDGINNYSDASLFLKKTGALCEQYDRTILGSVHSTKTKEGEAYSNPRHRVLGSVAWSAFSDLVITMDPQKADDPQDLIRVVNVLPRNSAEFTLLYKRDGPRLVPYEDPAESDLLSVLEFWLGQQPPERQIPRKEIIAYGRDTAALTEKVVEKWLERKRESGAVERVRHGIYRCPHNRPK